MKTIPKNEELHEASERLNKRLNDEFIRQQVELYKQEQTKRQNHITNQQRELEGMKRKKSEPQS